MQTTTPSSDAKAGFRWWTVNERRHPPVAVTAVAIGLPSKGLPDKGYGWSGGRQKELLLSNR